MMSLSMWKMAAMRLESYPDQLLCFWLGFLPVGIWAALLGAVVQTSVEVLLTQDVCFSSVACEFFKSIFLFGAPAALFAQLLGYWVRNVRPHSSHRWVWLCMLIPTCTFLLAGIQVQAVNECGTIRFNLDPDDTMIALCIYQCAALISSVLAIFVIGFAKLIRLAIQPPAVFLIS